MYEAKKLSLATDNESARYSQRSVLVTTPQTGEQQTAKKARPSKIELTRGCHDLSVAQVIPSLNKFVSEPPVLSKTNKSLQTA